ncbi:hypothetical protein FNV43_RR07342 [Rhamnella rubrinervis]|uniref:Transposase (putative) gypsy type domain-containing protein n=1 Tax=Rhamnella rubrinervis TaxID=2594499 RepID=A0A8K0HEL5_9ROSA|nr:hypothetical protein FNV43_RR07342 [Rhamnella rubrinervis]
MSYLKERFDMPSQIKLSAPEPLERADSPRDGWICLYEIAFKIRLRLPFHRIINMVLNFYSIAPGQLMPNSWRYLLGLIVQSEKCGLQIDMATFLYFFYMKPSEEGRYTLYAEESAFENAPTSDKGWKDRYFFVKREGLCDPIGTSESGIRSAWIERASNISERLRITAEQKNVIRTLLRTKTKSLLSILSEDSFRSRRSAALEEATSEQQAEQNFEEEDPSTHQSEEISEADMGKLKMKISKAELEATKKKKKDKQAAAKGGMSSQTDKGEERPTNRHPFCSTIRSDSSLVGPIVDSLMTRHDRSLLGEMEVGLEAEQNALKVTDTIPLFL